MTGSIVTFNDAIPFTPIEKLIAQIEPVQSGTGDPSPDNVRPISGWTGINGQMTGKNLLPEDYFINTSGTTFVFGQSVIYNTRKLWLKSNVNYTLQVDGNSEFTLYLRETSNVSVRLVNNYATFHNVTFTVSEDGLYALYAYKSSSYGAFTSKDDINWWQLEVGSTASDYEPYTVETLSVNWQDTTGTVYGGNIVVNDDGSGELVANMAMVDLGTLSWLVSDNNFFYSSVNGKKAGFTNMICSNYKTKQRPSWESDEVAISGNNSTRQIYIRDGALSGKTGAEFKEAMSGVQLVYELATPLTYSFSDLTQLSTVLGTNNIWVDTGEVTVTYQSTDSGLPLGYSFGSPLGEYNPTNLHLFNETFIENGMGD